MLENTGKIREFHQRQNVQTLIEIEFEQALYLCNERYETSDDHGPLQLLIKFTCIYSVPSVAEASFDPTDYQKPMIPTSPLTPK